MTWIQKLSDKELAERIASNQTEIYNSHPDWRSTQIAQCQLVLLNKEQRQRQETAKAAAIALRKGNLKLKIGDMVKLTRCQYDAPIGIIIDIVEKYHQMWYLCDWSLSKPRWTGQTQTMDGDLSVTKITAS
tara:strand:- start:61 stop:453 length:393 start_codon:yes stop_codon:yes gene_type:complete